MSDTIHIQHYPITPTGRRRYKLHADHEYGPAMLDYWGGNGRRWDDDAGCLFAYVGPDTTTSSMIEELAASMDHDGEFDNDTFPIIETMVLTSLLTDEILSDKGREGGLVDLAEELRQQFLDESKVEWEEAGDDLKQDWYDRGEAPQIVVMLEVEWLDPPIEINQVMEGATVAWARDSDKEPRLYTLDKIHPAADPRLGTNDAGYLAWPLGSDPKDISPESLGQGVDLLAGNFVTDWKKRKDSESWWLAYPPIHCECGRAIS